MKGGGDLGEQDGGIQPAPSPTRLHSLLTVSPLDFLISFRALCLEVDYLTGASLPVLILSAAATHSVKTSSPVCKLIPRLLAQLLDPLFTDPPECLMSPTLSRWSLR